PDYFYSFPQTNVISVVDVNNDGKLDIVGAASSNIITMLGNGDGTFGPMINSPSGIFIPTNIAVGDINRDGKMDVVVGTYTGLNTIRYYLGNGSGTFSSGTSIGGNYQLNGRDTFHLMDVDGDGRLDFVGQAVGPSYEKNIAVFRGNCGGGFD